MLHRFLICILLTGLCFLPIQTRAETSDLYGSWQGTRDDHRVGETTTQITFFGGGTFELSNHIVLTINFWEHIEGVDADKVDPIETIEMNVQGTWYTHADSLFLEATTLTMTFDSEDPLTVYIEAIAQTLDAEEELSAEEYKVLISFLKLTLTRLPKPNLEAEMIASFNADAGSATSYHLEGATLFIGFEGEKLLPLHRIEQATAVEAISWGRLKQTF